MHPKDKHNSAVKRLNAEQIRSKRLTRAKKITVAMFFLLVIIYFALMLTSCVSMAKPIKNTALTKEQRKVERRSIRPDSQRRMTVYFFVLASGAVLVLNSREE